MTSRWQNAADQGLILRFLSGVWWDRWS